jgi:hypothetical protein
MNINWVNSKAQIVTLNDGKNLKSQSAIISWAFLKDLGKKWFAFSKIDIGAVEMLTRLEEEARLNVLIAEKLGKVKVNG